MRSGCFPGSTYVFFTFSIAFCQSSPKPISRDAFFISASHHAYSRSAIAISRSGVYGIISCARSAASPAAPIGSPMIGSLSPSRMPTTRSRSTFVYALSASSVFLYGSSAHQLKSGS